MTKRKTRSATRRAFPANVKRTPVDAPRHEPPATILDYGSRTQPHFTAWLRAQLDGERCEAPWCTDGHVEELHHEPCGASKDDRSQLGLCGDCHRERHDATWRGPGRTGTGLILEGLASRHWRRYLTEVSG